MADQIESDEYGGRRQDSPALWKEFDRIQRAAQMLLERPLCPKGVFRFKTHDEFEEWKGKYQAELPSMDAIRKFLSEQRKTS